MRKELTTRSALLDRYLGCFGGFNINDMVCKKFCALNLRCAIEQEQNARREILNELVSEKNLYMTIQ
jgi:hypothetical protein